MKTFACFATWVLIVGSFAVLQANAAEIPNTPTPVNDGQMFHRTNDVLYGLVITAPVGMATKPWIGLLAGTAAGIGNEARYGSHFNTKHLLCIEVGSVAGYGLAKWSKHISKKNAVKYGY